MTSFQRAQGPAIAAALLLVSCVQPVVRAGDFQLAATAGGFTLLGPDGGVLLGDATLSTRTARARFEMQYGSFRITEPAAPPWLDGTRASVRPDGIELKSADGAVVGMARIRSETPGVVALDLEGAAG